MGESGGPYAFFDRDFHARSSIDSGSFHHPTSELVGVNDQIFLGEKLERTVPFHIDGVPKVAVNCWEHGNDDAVLMVVGCFSTFSPIANFDMENSF